VQNSFNGAARNCDLISDFGDLKTLDLSMDNALIRIQKRLQKVIDRHSQNCCWFCRRRERAINRQEYREHNAEAASSSPARKRASNDASLRRLIVSGTGISINIESQNIESQNVTWLAARLQQFLYAILVPSNHRGENCFCG
jgi:hypothetical protein